MGYKIWIKCILVNKNYFKWIFSYYVLVKYKIKDVLIKYNIRVYIFDLIIKKLIDFGRENYR